MSLDTKKIFLGTPDQQATGAIMSAPVGTDMPDTCADTLDSAFAASGYVSEDGLTVSPEYSTNDIKDWSGSTVRTVLEGFDGTVEFGLIQVDYEGAKQVFGDSYVTRTAATQTTGEYLKIAIGNHLPDPKAWVFNMKDGDRRLRVLVPNGQVTSVEELEFTSSDPVTLGVTISCYDDGTGNAIYVLTDDGQKVSA